MVAREWMCGMECLERMVTSSTYSRFEMSGIACLRILTRMGLFERVDTTRVLVVSVGNTAAYCSMESSCLTDAASVLVWVRIDGVQCSAGQPRERGENDETLS